MAKRRQPNRETSTARAAEAWKLRQLGHTQQQIADALGVSQQAVSRTLRKFDAKVLSELSEEIASEKISQRDRLHWLYSESIRAWEKSREPIKRVRKTTDEAGREVMVYTTVEQLGDYRHLLTAIGILGELRKLFGLDVKPAPQKLETAADIVLRLHTGEVA